MPSETRILVADDHPIVRAGIRQVVEAEADLRVVAEAADGVEALARIRASRPDIAVVDLAMPSLDGLGVLRAVRDEGNPVRVIVLTVHADPELYDAALAAGAAAYVLKDAALVEIVQAIRAVARGLHFTSPAVTTHLVRRGAKGTGKSAPPELSVLTPAERRVLKLVAEGKTSKEIADALGIHYRTVENHRTNICQKLSLTGSHALVRYALKRLSDLG